MVKASRPWPLICLVGGVLLWLACGGPPQWRSPQTPGVWCDPARIFAEDPKWQSSFVNVGYGFACLQMTWSDGQSSKSNVTPVILWNDGRLAGKNPDKDKDVYDQPISFQVPERERHQSRRFKLFVLQPNGYNFNEHQSACNAMLPPNYSCLSDEEKDRCWFSITFRPQNSGYDGELAPLPEGTRGWCHLETRQGSPDNAGLNDSGQFPKDGSAQEGGEAPDTTPPEVCLPKTQAEIKYTTNNNVGNGFFHVTYSPKGTYIAALDTSRGLTVWNRETGDRMTFELDGRRNVATFGFSDDTHILVYRDATPGNIQHISLTNKRSETLPTNSARTLRLLSVHPTPSAEKESPRYASLSERGAVQWHILKGNNSDNLAEIEGWANGLGFSTDGNYLAAATNGKIYAWRFQLKGDAASLVEPKTFDVAQGITGLSWLLDPAGQHWLAILQNPKAIKVIKVPSGESYTKESAKTIAFFVWHPSASVLAVGEGTNDASLRLMDLSPSGEIKRNVTFGVGSSNGPVRGAWHPNGKEIAVGVGKTVRIWRCDP